MTLTNFVGPAGPVGLNNRGTWTASPSPTYSIRDAVRRANSGSPTAGGYFLALSSGLSSDPLVDTTHWFLITTDGATGLGGAPSGAAGGVLGGTYPNPTFGTSALQTLRTSAGSFTASQQRDVAFTWATPFADTSYTIVASLEDTAPTSQSSALRDIRSKGSAGFTARIGSGSVGYSAGQLLVSAIGIHD